METIQYNATLAITGPELLYQELGLENFEQRRWYMKICYFHKILKSHSLK